MDDGVGGQLPAWVILSEDGMRADAATPDQVFYNDMTAQEASEVAKTLKHHSYRTLSSKLTYPAYRDIPTTYILCTKDNAVPVAAQEGMVAAARSSGAQIQTVRLEASHSPFRSKPDEVAEVCRKSAEGQL